jgi:hypothetical protein
MSIEWRYSRSNTFLQGGGENAKPFCTIVPFGRGDCRIERMCHTHGGANDGATDCRTETNRRTQAN